MATIGVLLSGCGVFDGSEIHEATLTLYFLAKAGAKVVCLAPEMDFEAVDHSAKTPSGQRRNVRVEAARIARGPVADAATVSAADLDGLILPGGLGAAVNLCDFAVKGATKHMILESFETRVGNGMDREFETAVAQVCRIFRFRLEDRVSP